MVVANRPSNLALVICGNDGVDLLSHQLEDLIAQLRRKLQRNLRDAFLTHL